MPSPTLQGHERPTSGHKEEEKEKAKIDEETEKRQKGACKTGLTQNGTKPAKAVQTGPPASARLSKNKMEKEKEIQREKQIQRKEQEIWIKLPVDTTFRVTR